MKRTKKLNKLKKLEKTKQIKKQKRMLKVKEMQTAEKQQKAAQYQKDHNFLWEYIFKLATGQIDKEIEKEIVLLKPMCWPILNLENLRLWANFHWDNYRYVKTYHFKQHRPKYLVKRLEAIYEFLGLFRDCSERPYLMLIILFSYDLSEELKKQ